MTGEFKIEVVDRFSKGIAGAQVAVQARSGPTRAASKAVSVTETNFNGLAVLSLKAGTYLVSVSKPEYRAEPREAKLLLAVRDGQASPASLRFMLLPLIGRQDLADDAVGYEQIGADEVHAYQIADDAVEYEHIAGNAVAGYQIADRAVTGDHIADGAVVARHLAPGSVDSQSLSEKVRRTLTAGAVAPIPPTPKPVAGRVIVATEGGDYASLGDAVKGVAASSKKSSAEAAPPVVIDVMPGVYEETSAIRLPPQVSLRGAGRECTEIRFARGGLVVEDGNECAVSSVAILSPGIALRITSSAVRVDNCFLSAGDTGISAQASTLLARGNILRKGARGVRVLGCDLRLLSNELDQLTVCGLEVRTSNARVLHNTFVDNARDLDVRDMQGGRRCLVSFNVLRDIVADHHARTRIFEGQNLTAAAAPLEPWEDL